MKPSELVEGYFDHYQTSLNREQSGISTDDLANALMNRLEYRYPDIVANTDPRLVKDAVRDTASFHAGAEELGSSDISIMLRSIIEYIESEGNRYQDMPAPAVDEGTGGAFGSMGKDEIDPNNPGDMAWMSKEIAQTLSDDFGGKAWFNGGSYSYLMDVRRPKLMVASDGSRVRIKNFADGVHGWASKWVWEDMSTAYPDYYKKFFRPFKKIGGQEDHEVANMRGDESVAEDQAVDEGYYEDDWAKRKAAANREKMAKVGGSGSFTPMKPFQKPAATKEMLAAMGEPMVADWFAGGGYDSVRDGIIDMANDKGLRWSTAMIDSVITNIWGIKPGDMPEDMSEGQGAYNSLAPVKQDMKTVLKNLKFDPDMIEKIGRIKNGSIAVKVTLIQGRSGNNKSYDMSAVEAIAKQLTSMGHTVIKYAKSRTEAGQWGNYSETPAITFYLKDTRETTAPVVEDRYEDSWAKNKAAQNRDRMSAEKAAERERNIAARPPRPVAKTREEKKAELNNMLNHMAWDIQTMAGETFPDVDPYEMLARKYRKIDQTGKLMKYLDTAARKFLKVKNYNDFMIQFYDQQAGDDSERWGDLGGKGNPFRESIATEMKEKRGQDEIDSEWKPKSWEQVRAEAISNLQLSINQRIEDQGWSGLGTGFGNSTYNRDWKKDISRAKKILARMKRGEGEDATGGDLYESKSPSAILEGLTIQDAK